MLHSSAGWHRSRRRPWRERPRKIYGALGALIGLHRMGGPPRWAGQSLVHRADGRVRRALRRRARQPAGPALVHHGRQSGVRADRRDLRPRHSRPGLAAAAAGSLAIAAMFTLRCLHPPSGAVALTAVLGGPAVASLGYGFVLAGGAELRDPAVHRRGLQRRARCAATIRAPRRAGRLASDARPAPSARLGFPAPTWTRR